MSNRVVGLVIGAHFPQAVSYQYKGKTERVMGSTAKWVLALMANSCTDEGRSACQSISTIQEQSCLSRPAVISAMRALASMGLIRAKGIHRVYRTTNYEVNVIGLASMNDPLFEYSGDSAGLPDSKPSLPISNDDSKPDGKPSLPIGDDGKPDSKPDGKPSLPYPLTINLEEEEEEEKDIPLSASGSEEKTPAAEPAARPNIFGIYEQEIGPLTPMIAEALGEAVDTDGDWVEKAVREAAEAGARNWKYINAILMRWRKEGYGTDSRPRRKRAGTQPSSDGRIRTDEEFRRAADQFLQQEAVVDVQ